MDPAATINSGHCEGFRINLVLYIDSKHKSNDKPILKDFFFLSTTFSPGILNRVSRKRHVRHRTHLDQAKIHPFSILGAKTTWWIMQRDPRQPSIPISKLIEHYNK